jgi:glutamate-1-semialdehyde 2,1-aminomutase
MAKDMTTIALIQARMGSSRLPGKVLRHLYGKPVVDWVIDRSALARRIDRIVLATSDSPADDVLAAHAAARGVAVERGSERDVLDRFARAAAAQKADVVVRITADCPLIDPALIDAVVDCRASAGADYASNIVPPTFPDGLDVEAFTAAALARAAAEATEPFDREHVTPYLRRDPFTRAHVTHTTDLSGLRWTVDEEADLETVNHLVAALGGRSDFSWQEAVAAWQSNPQAYAANAGIIRNQGATMGSGQKLWKRAKQIIPGGNMLLSKRAEMFLPEQWPAYFSRAKGCTVWDLDGREMTDLSLMGIGTNTLGYGDPEVDAAVRGVIDNGNLSTLNCPEEVWLAEKLIALNPFAGMVRFTRSGGEANAVAIRIARAASGRDGVAVCGYHGWHDWYLSANLGADDSLAGHLLPGLDPKGVPKALRGVVHPFNYNDLAALESIVATGTVGVIKMEVVRNAEPRDGFLQKVRDLATRNGIVLVFDECTSGFRETYGGLYLKYGVEPDIAVYGKTLGNGYAINAIVGRREVMEAAQTTFISSTFWTERIGPSAALKTLDVMARERSWERITEIGRTIRGRWQQLADHHRLAISHSGLPALATFSFAGANALAYKTLLTQEMLKRGYLATTGTYACLAHTPEVIDRYTEALDSVFALIYECELGRDVNTLLEGPVCHTGFRRIN